MIARPHRFHGFNSLRFAYSRGQTIRGSLMTLKFIINNKRSVYRAAVVVSRKVHKSAVVRNRIRRRVYELIRSHEAAISQPYDIVLSVYSEQVATISADELEVMVKGLLAKAGIIATGEALPARSHAIVEPKE